jgi:iron(III) transport system permease protein
MASSFQPNHSVPVRAKPFQKLQWLRGWTLLTLAIALLITTPVLAVLSSIFIPTEGVWEHLASTVLWRYIFNSLLLMVGVGGGVLLIGVGTAWLVTLCRFPGQRIFEWLLLLPLAAPAYVLAYTYTEWLEFYGPVQTALRTWFAWETVQEYWFPPIRSLGGAIALLSLVLYPYVYLLARVAFLEQAVCTLEASRSLGCGPWRSFWTVALPLARPAITAGLALALMETLNDFGTVQYFGVETFTTGIYRTWFGLGDQAAAAQLATVLMIFIFWLILLEQWSRRQATYYQGTTRQKHLPTYKLSGWRGIGAGLACVIPVGLGLILPMGLLLKMTLDNASETLNESFWQLTRNSFGLAGITAAIAVGLALILAYGNRLQGRLKLMQVGVRVAAMGYAIPGSVIAVGVLVPLGRLDNVLTLSLERWFGIDTGLLLSGTAIALIFAYLVRFLAVSFNTLDSSLGRIQPSLDDAARSLGQRSTGTLMRVHIPLMWGSLMAAGMLVFVDVMKELPATLVIRPFNFDTLAIRVYQYASDERLVEASAPALAILLVGLLPVMLLSWRIAHTRSRQS